MGGWNEEGGGAIRIRFSESPPNSAAGDRKAGAHRGRLMRKGEAGAEGGTDGRKGAERVGEGGMAMAAAGAGESGDPRESGQEVAIQGNPTSPSLPIQFTEGAGEAE